MSFLSFLTLFHFRIVFCALILLSVASSLSLTPFYYDICHYQHFLLFERSPIVVALFVLFDSSYIFVIVMLNTACIANTILFPSIMFFVITAATCVAAIKYFVIFIVSCDAETIQATRVSTRFLIVIYACNILPCLTTTGSLLPS